MWSSSGRRPRSRMRMRAALGGRTAAIYVSTGRSLLVLACMAARGSALHQSGHGSGSGLFLGQAAGWSGRRGHNSPRQSRFQKEGTGVYGWSSVFDVASNEAILTDGQGYRQKMENVEDAQYLSYMSLGDQVLSGIMDTGSSDLVVFPKGCSTCGHAAAYDPTASKSHHTVGNMSRRMSYESGSVDCRAASDLMTVGPHRHFNQTFWEAAESQMELLGAASFQTIIGLMPESAHRQFGLLATTRERSFSICLGRDKLSEGVFVWNDTSAALHPELFHRVPVIGDGSWTVRATNARFSFLADRVVAPKYGAFSPGGVEHLAFDMRSSRFVGCEEGCSFMLDSGSTVLGIPGEVASLLAGIVSRDDINCNNMWELPYLTFEMNGKTFSLSPDAYLARTTDDPQLPSFLQNVAEVRTLTASNETKGSKLDVKYCQLAVIAVGAKKKAGPLWVLGMPFFRKYYTSFQLGDGPEHHAVHVAGQSDHCTPTHRNVEVHNGSAKMWQRTIDPSKLSPPRSKQQSVSGLQLFRAPRQLL